MTDRQKDETLVGLMGNDGGPRIATFEQPLAGIDEQASAERLGIGGVAFIAMLHEHRPNFRFKEIDLRIGLCNGPRPASTACDPDHDKCTEEFHHSYSLNEMFIYGQINIVALLLPHADFPKTSLASLYKALAG
jgi:hypothetical protein